MNFKLIAARIAATHCTRIMCATGAKEIERALESAFRFGIAWGEPERSAASFPESLERVDWAGVIKAAGSK